MITVKQLRDAGYKVRVTHKRLANNDGKIILGTRRQLQEELPLTYSQAVLPHGGRTRIDITPPNKDVTYSAITACAENEAYCKKEGLKRALFRALLLMEDDGNGPRI